jgi:hypothetical protein
MPLSKTQNHIFIRKPVGFRVYRPGVGVAGLLVRPDAKKIPSTHALMAHDVARALARMNEGGTDVDLRRHPAKTHWSLSCMARQNPSQTETKGVSAIRRWLKKTDKIGLAALSPELSQAIDQDCENHRLADTEMDKLLADTTTEPEIFLALLEITNLVRDGSQSSKGLRIFSVIVERAKQNRFCVHTAQKILKGLMTGQYQIGFNPKKLALLDSFITYTNLDTQSAEAYFQLFEQSFEKIWHTLIIAQAMQKVHPRAVTPVAKSLLETVDSLQQLGIFSPLPFKFFDYTGNAPKGGLISLEVFFKKTFFESVQTLSEIANPLPLPRLNLAQSWGPETEKLAMLWLVMRPQELSKEELKKIGENLDPLYLLYYQNNIAQRQLDLIPLQAGISRFKISTAFDCEKLKKFENNGDFNLYDIYGRKQRSDLILSYLASHDIFLYILWETGFSWWKIRDSFQNFSPELQAKIKKEGSYAFYTEIEQLGDAGIDISHVGAYAAELTDFSNISTEGYVVYLEKVQPQLFETNPVLEYYRSLYAAKKVGIPLLRSAREFYLANDPIRSILHDLDATIEKTAYLPLSKILPIHLLKGDEAATGVDLQKINAIRAGLVGKLLETGWKKGEAANDKQLKAALLEVFEQSGQRQLPPVVSKSGRAHKHALLLNSHHRLAALITLVADGILPVATLDRLPVALSTNTTDEILENSLFDEKEDGKETVFLSWFDLLYFHPASLRLLAKYLPE